MAFSTNDTFANVIETPPAPRQGTCRRCRKPATLICMRCEDCYCSKKCQDVDWKSHRYICFPKPPLLEMDTVPNDDNLPDLIDMEPAHLAEQLRSMVNVCQDFLKRLDKQPPCKCNNKFRVTDVNNEEHSTIPVRSARKHYEERNGVDSFKGKFNGNGHLQHEERDEMSLNFNENGAKKKVLKAQNFFNLNDDFMMTPDDSTVTDFKVNNKHMERTNKRKVVPEPVVTKSSNGDVSFTENSCSDVCSIASSKAGSDGCEDNVVYLTSFRSANRVAVCPKQLVKNGSLDKTIDQIDKYGQNAPKIGEMPQPESFVVALRSNRYARAKIVTQKDTNPERIRLEFVDFGNLAYRKLSELREILPALADLPIHVNVVQLSKVDLINYDDRILRFFSTFEKKYYKMKKLPYPTNKNAVELFDCETGESMNELIIQEFKKHEMTSDVTKAKTFKNRARAKDDDNSKEKKNENKENIQKKVTRSPQKFEAGPILEPPFKFNSFSKNARNFKVVILDTAMAEFGYIACILQSNLVHLTQIQGYLEKEFESDEPYTPIDNEYVIAKFEDESWYRGKVVGISANKKEFEISYIDFLNEAKLTSKDIRRYPDDLKIDCYTSLCMMGGLPKNLPTDLKAFLRENFKINDIIHIDRVVELIDEEIAVIECHEFIDRLNEKGLL